MKRRSRNFQAQEDWTIQRIDQTRTCQFIERETRAQVGGWRMFELVTVRLCRNLQLMRLFESWPCRMVGNG